MEGRILGIVQDLISRYGEKARIILKAMVDIAKRNRMMGNDRYGDFDHKSLVQELEARGLKYNPSQFLRMLEREYNIIETTYHTSSQHWYKIKDLESLEYALRVVDGFEQELVEDPEILMLKIQIKALRISEIIKFLKRLQMKNTLSRSDVKKFEEFVFRKLPKIVALLKKTEDFEEYFESERRLLREVLELSLIVAEKLEHNSYAIKSLVSVTLNQR